MRLHDGRLYYSYGDIHRTICALAATIRHSGYAPDVTVAIGTGGFIPARILKTYLKLPILTVGVVYYGEDHNPMERPRTLQWIDEVERKLAGRKVLLVDEVDDTRSTLSYCLRELLRHEPREIAVAVLHNKRKPKRDVFPPQVQRYYAGEEVDDAWICYPWDATDVDRHERVANGLE